MAKYVVTLVDTKCDDSGMNYSLPLAVSAPTPYSYLGLGLHCSTVEYSTVQYTAVQWSIVQYTAVQWSTVQYTAVQWSMVHCTLQYSGVQCIIQLLKVLVFNSSREIQFFSNKTPRSMHLTIHAFGLVSASTNPCWYFPVLPSSCLGTDSFSIN